MEILNEATADLRHYKEILFNKAWKRYEYIGNYGPVIGITGVGGGWHRPVRNYMEHNQVKGVLSYFGFLNKGIDSYLPQLDAEVHKYQNPIIVGFSVGGFIALRYAEKYGWGRVQKVITVATPFEGAYTLPGVFGKTFVELLPESPMLEQIKAINPPNNKLLSLLSKDRYTPNPWNIRLKWPTAILDGDSHGSLQSNWEKISSVLGAELGI